MGIKNAKSSWCWNHLQYLESLTDTDSKRASFEQEVAIMNLFRNNPNVVHVSSLL